MAMEKLFQAVEEKRISAPSTTISIKPGRKEKKSTFSEDDVNAALLEVCHMSGNIYNSLPFLFVHFMSIHIIHTIVLICTIIGERKGVSGCGIQTWWK